MEGILQIILILLVLQLLFVIWNIRQLPRIKGGSYKPAAKPPTLITVLIPARNEQYNIGDCLRSILGSDYENLEVLVLDDRSDDRTSEVVCSIASSDPRVRLIEGKALPSGWAGKVFACHQLAEHASGEWWLFMDADARLARDALSSTLVKAQEQGRGLITGFPFQVVRSPLERLIVPLMTFTIACHLPVKMVRASQNPRFVAAHGAFMFIHRESYRMAGGHKAIADQLVDDMALARRMKEASEPVTLANIHEIVTMRMYHSGKEVWSGFRKNIFTGVGRNIPILLGMIMLYGLLYIVPSLVLIISLYDFIAEESASHVTLTLFLWSAVCTLLGMGIKLAADLSSGQPAWLAIGTPLSMVLLIVLALDSCRGAYSNKGYQWKGRYYS